MKAYSDLEWNDRKNVAALCRLIALHRMQDAANQAVILRSSEKSEHMITHRLGDFFEEVTASSLIRIDHDGVDVHTGEKMKLGEIGGLNGGLLNLGAPIFEDRPEINCLIHAHAKSVAIVATQKCGLRALSQPALFIRPLLAYWPYVFVEDENFRDNFKKMFRGKKVSLTNNHGFYTIGTTPAEAFFFTFYLAQACDLQVSAMATNEELHEISDENADLIAESMYNAEEYHYDGRLEWGGWIRMVERNMPDYAN